MVAREPHVSIERVSADPTVVQAPVVVSVEVSAEKVGVRVRSLHVERELEPVCVRTEEPRAYIRLCP